MVLDADEFLNVHVGGGMVPELLAAAPEATAILINWRIFGNSGHERWSPGLVTRRYTRAAEQAHGVNRSFKTLFTRPDRSEEHTSELQSLMRISYAVFCLKKKKKL